MADKKIIPEYADLCFNLTAMFGARIDDVYDENGSIEKCVCIPIDRNGLQISKNGEVRVYAYVNKTRNANRMGWTHYIKLKMPTRLKRKLIELGYEIPFVGNMKPSGYVPFLRCAYNDRKGEKVNIDEYGNE